MAIFNKEIFYPYDISRNPKTTSPAEFLDNPEKGGNCELMVQAIVSARGFILPRLRSSEIYEDTEYTEKIGNIFLSETGDIVGLKARNKKDFHGIHIGIILIDNDGEIHLVHNTKHMGRAMIEPIAEAIQYPQHDTIAWIKRPMKEDPSLLQSERLKEMGFDFLTRKV